MTISACMIVKNEEKILLRAIECLKNFADEIIIVDTGSTDSTKKIAARYADKVFDFNMHDDFSTARNFAFSKCSMEYIYSADADEVIDKNNLEKLKALKNNLASDIDIVQMQYSNQLQFASVYNYETEYRPKLFRRLRSFRWIDPIHEIIDTQVHIMDSDIVIIHMPRESHAERDFFILERIAKRGTKLSQRLHRLYAQELFITGSDQDFLNAYDYFEWTLHEEALGLAEIRQSQCVVARCCNIRRDYNGLFKVALKNTVGRPSAEVCCELGRYYFEQEDFEEAAIWYFTAAFGAECELNIHCSNDMPLKKLSNCYLKLGDKVEAEKYEKMATEWQVKRKAN